MFNDNEKRKLPIVAIVVSVLMIAIGLRFAYGFYFDPAGVAPGVDAGSAVGQRMLHSMGARSLAMALALLLALLLKSRQALIVVLSMRALTELQDLLIAINTGVTEPGLRIVVPALIVFELAAIFMLWRSGGRDAARLKAAHESAS